MADPITGFFNNILGGATQVGGASDTNPAQYQSNQTQWQNGDTSFSDGQTWVHNDGNWTAQDQGSKYPGTGQTQNEVMNSDPNYNPSNTGTLGANTYSTGTASTGTAASTVDQNADDRDYLNQTGDLYQSLLDRLRGETTRQGNESIESSYQGAKNDRELQRSRDVETQDFQQLTSDRDKTSAIGRVDTNARTLNDSLQRILGLAGGRSSARGVANNAVSRQASGERTGVLEDYGRNQFQLDKRKDESGVDFENILKELLASRNTAQQDFETGLGEEEQRLISGQSRVAEDRAELDGTSTFAAQKPYFQQSEDIRSRLSGLPDQYANQVSAREYEAKPVSLRDYTVDRAAINANRGNTSAGQSTYSPYSQFLKRDEEQRIA